MSFTYLEHATDAFIEVNAPTLEEAFLQAGLSVIDTTIDINSVDEKEQKKITVNGDELRYLLFNWLEELIFVLITEGFAIKRIKLSIEKNQQYGLDAVVFGESMDLKKHGFKVEIKAPTFHLMEIEQNEHVKMRYLLDL